MASKKSSSLTASPTPSPTPPCPAPNQSPAVIEHSFFMHRRFGAKTMTTATTLSPTPDPNEYEKWAHKNIYLDDSELHLLKEHVRLLNGLPLAEEKPLRRITKLKPPKVWPRATLTSRGRAQLQQRRLVVRCGSNLKEKVDEYDDMMKSSDSALVYRQLREDAMARTSEEMDLLFEHQELENLKYLAANAREHELVEYRDNQGSRLRFNYIRGEPIISTNFRDAYDDYMKPPFIVPHRICRPKVYNIPKIDKRKEIWLVPVEEDEGIPLHMRPKTPDPKDKRSRKERARPVVKKGKRTPMKEWRDKKSAKQKRPPWKFTGACSPNIGWFN
ncbi:hypothetical protein V9T40_014104 [Parthenolecanium corni]|uniref:Uncharacterized protein n=1 Tax=Parthenolecanium corni TaxID=536013 RepID=A0AAN9TTA5_9HEMI